MPLRKRLVLDFSPAEETPLPVILKVEKDRKVEEFYCQVQPGWTEGVFRIMLDPRYPGLPNVITESDFRPQDIVSVCATPEGHLYLDVGHPITLSFSIWDGFNMGSMTLAAGTLIDFMIPGHA